MKLDRATVSTLFSTELRTVLRDRRTVIMSIVLPLLVMPLMLYAGRFAEQRRATKLKATEYTYAVVGTRVEAARAAVAAAPAAAPEKVGDGGLREPNAQRFKEVEAADAAAALENGEIHFYLETASGEEAAAAAAAEREKRVAKAAELDGEASSNREERSSDEERDSSDMDTGGEAPRAGVPAITVVYRADRDASETGARTMRDRLRGARRSLRDVTLREHGLPVAPQTVGAVATADVATTAEVTGLKLGRFLTLFLLLFVLSGGSVVATDTLAGEKERGTLETLLTTAVSRREVIVAKLLLILAVALMITLIQVANLLVYVGFKLVPAPENFAAAITPARAALLLLLYLPVIALASSVLLLTSGRAKTYKEAQLYFFPVFLLGLIPTLAPMLPGVKLRSVIALVPVANLAVAVKEVLVGMPDWPMIALAWLVTAGAAAWVAVLAERTLSTERLITAADVGAEELRGGPALFPRHVLRWFAVMWAIMFAVSANLGEGADIRVQLAFNLGVLFLGGSFLMIRRYRLDPRAALALRAPRPAVWLAVLVGAPAGLLTATGVFVLANRVFPVPQKMLEAFGQGLAPDTIPFWQLLLLLTVTPGICEEIAFRGVLLHGLRRRFSPVVLALVTGAIFGFFHTSLFRIVPTGFLGVLLAAVTLLTGSIFPAMLWHALNNALGVLGGRYGIVLYDLDAWLYLAGAAVLALAFWIIWRNRTPYPDLRPPRRT
jgi:sodium transport system permease protein